MIADILNIAIVPVHAKDTQYIVATSQVLNTPRSRYYLRKTEEAKHHGSSLPHVTLMHFRVPQDTEKQKLLLQKLSPFIGKTIQLRMTQRYTKTVDGFLKADLLNNITRAHPLTVTYFGVEKSTELMHLQEEIINAIDDNNALITSRNTNYSPHFTVWASEPYAGLEQPSPTDLNYSFLGKVIIGTCGEIGQLEDIYKSDEVAKTESP